MPNFQKVSPGDEWQGPNADLTNGLIDLLQGGDISATYKPGKGFSGNPSIVRIQNNSGAGVSAFNVMQFDGPTIVPPVQGASDTGGLEDRFKASGIMNVQKPSGDGGGRWCVLLQPLAPKAFGYAAVTGITIARVNLSAKADKFVETESGQTVLKSGGVGSARILWVAGSVGNATNTGEQWAVIKLDETSTGTSFAFVSAPMTAYGVYSAKIGTPNSALAATAVTPSNIINYSGAAPDIILVNLNPLDQAGHTLLSSYWYPSFYIMTTTDGKQVFGTYAFGFAYCDNVDPEIDPDWHDTDGSSPVGGA